jgi:hypothetical protein
MHERGRFRVFVLLVATTALTVVWASPAYAICSSDKTNSHTVGSVSHGWSRTFCQPSGDYNFNVWTNHGHGQKYVALWHSDTSHLHCDDLESGSVNASCTKSGINVHHMSYHDIAGGVSCTDRFNDGHGFDCHDMEALP